MLQRKVDKDVSYCLWLVAMLDLAIEISLFEFAAIFSITPPGLFVTFPGQSVFEINFELGVEIVSHEEEPTNTRIFFSALCILILRNSY